MSTVETPGGVTFLGVRHHSPACARLVAATVARLRPAYVLVEGPADLNGRMDELLGDHELPIAVFTAHRDGNRRHASWSPFCAYSPEWVALTAGREVGAQLRFIDLPAWHPALSGRANRYADADQRYAEAVRRLCATLAVDNVDALWDHLFEIGPDDGLAERLDTYFDVLRGESAAGEDDTAREAYMARWVRAARRRAAGRPVLVVTGGFHRPALVRLTAGAGDDGPEDEDWPEVPAPAPDAVAGSYLVPYSFRRLDAFVGYQSGMPSPAYYQRVWEDGPRRGYGGDVGGGRGRHCGLGRLGRRDHHRPDRGCRQERGAGVGERAVAHRRRSGADGGEDRHRRGAGEQRHGEQVAPAGSTRAGGSVRADHPAVRGSGQRPVPAEEG